MQIMIISEIETQFQFDVSFEHQFSRQWLQFYSFYSIQNSLSMDQKNTQIKRLKKGT